MGPRDGDRGRWTLASLDSLGDSADLRAHAQQSLSLDSGDQLQPDRFEGADETNSIRVVVDAQSRVVSIDIHPQWKRQVGVDGFGSGLLSSYTAAVHESMSFSIRAALDTEPESHQAVSVPHPRAAESELGDDEWLRRTWATLHNIKAQLSRLEQADDAAQPDERTVSGPQGLVTLRLRGRSLVGIEADTGRIAFADPDQLRFDALDAFRAAALAAEG
ncbi:MAG TPA: hypothetical protein VFX61_10230 [Micromonosporaceae bacterium]|nr:hypothetical protein [Micromonosporaceae bacterium]